MPSHRSKIYLATLLLASLSSSLMSKEMPRSLREAEHLYQNGKYEEASDKALEFQKLYPDNLQALLILGMSDFYLNDFESSKNWFLKAQRKSPKHPIVTKYLNLLRELEYRSGIFSIEPSQKILDDDPMVKAEFFKKGYFTHAFPKESEVNHPGAPVGPLEPILLKEPVATITMRLESDLALPIPYPDLERLFSDTEYVEKMADEAMKDHKYKKAMLLYSQLYRSNPDKPKYLISQADAEFHMKRYQRVLDLLTPIASRKSIRSMPEEEKNRLRTIFKESAKQMYGISLEPAQEAGE